jgi:hypothetical protein
LSSPSKTEIAQFSQTIRKRGGASDAPPLCFNGS